MHNAVYDAIKNDDHQMLEKLAEAGLDINAPNESGWTPAHLAARRGNLECLKVLAKYAEEEDINVYDDDGWTPALYAKFHDYDKCVEFLTKYRS